MVVEEGVGRGGSGVGSGVGWEGVESSAACGVRSGPGGIAEAHHSPKVSTTSRMLMMLGLAATSKLASRLATSSSVNVLKAKALASSASSSSVLVGMLMTPAMGYGRQGERLERLPLHPTKP